MKLHRQYPENPFTGRVFWGMLRNDITLLSLQFNSLWAHGALHCRMHLSMNRIAWCDNLVPNVYGTEVYLTCSLNDAQDVIIFQVKTTFSHPEFIFLLRLSAL